MTNIIKLNCKQSAIQKTDLGTWKWSLYRPVLPGSVCPLLLWKPTLIANSITLTHYAYDSIIQSCKHENQSSKLRAS